jgi:hypothetical protein
MRFNEYLRYVGGEGGFCGVKIGNCRARTIALELLDVGLRGIVGEPQ